MNWSDIKEKNPKAWAKFITWQFANGSKYIMSPFDFLAQEWRWQKSYLFDFFDQLGIIIEIQASFDSRLNWAWTINKPTGYIPEKLASFESITRTRSEAEEDALTKSFEILEKTL